MKRLLFVAPAVPGPSGNGLRMRGWLFLKGLASDHRVTLVAGSPAFPDESRRDLEQLGGLVEEAVLLHFRPSRDAEWLRRRLARRLGWDAAPAWDWAEPTARMRRQLARLRGRRYDRAHVFRLFMLPVALAALADQADVPVQLDLDDWESQARLAQAKLAAPGSPRRARRLAAEAAALAAWERAWLPRCGAVLVPSAEDAAGLAAWYGLRDVAVIPNAVPVPRDQPPAWDGTPPAELLFVGALGYYPNQDAVSFLLREVLPALRRGSPAVRLVVAGGGAPPAVRAALRAAPDAWWVDAPATVEPLYARAAVALAPIRAGGGTRVKALEAFARGRPLIATATAMAGLDVQPGAHYLRAETPAEWVAAVRALLEAPELAARLTAASFAWVRERRFEVVAEQVATHARG